MIAIRSWIGSKTTLFSIRLGVWIVFDGVGSKKCGRQFPIYILSGCLEKRGTPSDRSCREIGHIRRRERPISNNSGAKAHANVLIGTFSTDSRSDCIIRIGFRTAVIPLFWGTIKYLKCGFVPKRITTAVSRKTKMTTTSRIILTACFLTRGPIYAYNILYIIHTYVCHLKY